MPKFIIERSIPGAGKLSREELHQIAKKSNQVLQDLGPGIQWVHSYVTNDKLYCVYRAQTEEQIAEHARKGGFPVDRIEVIHDIMDPTTGE
ncbi:DUF4242 domain-containing protein [Kyrpidia spormannii]|uniref:DUF4242 domain-containing protein n=2 Tax=Kyrpidia spormannii TaxID=2055160 RepID=A0A2K8N663_9BACL|nr:MULTISPECIES: DUF4242 domain-containing protein [Kyrpidia]HHY68081.1 DUF4242 domain-containing protein [Alicyclobacillus sp.]ATY84575.1 DUF4242 domain-containing protein [Kyrpidia spormannii]MCL6577374.1 DUF4242 domain-containing protein [Kyrpidia sp.]CAB3391322.1 conserved protein of unknown function [Kyrpidia spormannii]CAB3392235.1 conserved protein of unknown function [Kyrpidia spormannii]